MAWERELIGFYATDHPLARHERVLRKLASCTSTALRDREDRASVRLGGMIRAPRISIVKSGRNEGKRMAFFQLEDFAGVAECVVFSRTYAELEPLIVSDQVVFVEGQVDTNRETPSLHVKRIFPAEDGPREMAKGLLVRLQAATSEALGRLRETVTTAPGSLPLVLEFETDSNRLARVRTGPAWSVRAEDALLDRLGALPDVAAVEYLAQAP